MVIYADIIFLNNTIMTFAIIWAVGHILDHKIYWWRILLAAIIGTIYTFIILYVQFSGFPQIVSIFFHLILNVISALIMIYIAFVNLSLPQFWKTVAYLYLISFVVIGTTLSLLYIYGITPLQTKNTLFIVIGLLVLFIIGKHGWIIFQKKMKPEEFLLSLEINIKNAKITVIGLVDTGNTLKDPITQVPVIVIEFNKIFPIFSKELQKKLTTNKGGIMDLVTIFNNYGWANRVRVLPFSDLGQEHGMLIGLRPDHVKLTYKGNSTITEKVIIALSMRKIDENDEYQALVNPQVLPDS